MPSFLQLQTGFSFPWLRPESLRAVVGRENADKWLTKGLQLHPIHQKRARAHLFHRKKMNKPDTQQKMTSSPLGIRYQGTGFLKGTWAQRQNEEQRKKIHSIYCCFRGTPFAQRGRITEPTKNKGLESADTGAGQGQADPGLGSPQWHPWGLWGHPYEGRDWLSPERGRLWD